MRLLARYYDADRGEVRVGGNPVGAYDRVELRRAVGVVFEETFLFSDTVAANIAFGRPAASRAQVERAAQLAGAAEFIAELPAGYATEVGERGYGLSGGQRQRLAIARAILTDPGVLILDDATSAVDASKEHEIHAAIQEVVKGRTTLVIAHRPATIALADRVALLDAGTVVDTGTHDELLDRSARYREVLATEAEEVSGP
jgi:ATP-binding cassette subfamily B protein